MLRAIENSVSLKERRYAIIADEAHSSQSGSTARQLKEVLMIEGSDDDEKELTSDDLIAAAVATRRANSNLSFFAFTATPKTKTLELFGRLPDPKAGPSKDNKPAAFHVYSMRQAIEEGLVYYAYTVRDKVRENGKVMSQLANNSNEQALLGDFPKAVDDAILDSSDAHENQKMQLLSDPKKAAAFARLVFDLLKWAS